MSDHCPTCHSDLRPDGTCPMCDPQTGGKVLDLMAALKQSLAAEKAKRDAVESRSPVHVPVRRGQP